MKASVELCINKPSDAAAKSELKANCEKYGSEFGELGTPGGLADSFCQVSWRFGRAPKNWQIDHPDTQQGRQELMHQLPETGVSLCLTSQEECVRSSLKKDKTKYLKLSWRTPNRVFVTLVALQNKFHSPANFREILGASQRLLHMFCRPLGKVYDRVPREKLWGVLREYDVNGCLLLAVK